MLKTLAIILVSLITLGFISGCTDLEQKLFFVDLGDEVAQTQSLEQARSEWSIETATPAQHNVLDALADQAAKNQWLQAVHDNQQAIHNNPFLACVRNHESATAGLYAAENPTSTASGAYQFLDSTWRVVSAQAGHPGYARAIYAPWYVQDAVAYDLAIVRGQRFHWDGTGC